MIIPYQYLKKLVPNATHYGPCSVDLRLGLSFAKRISNIIDFAQADQIQYHKFTTDKPVILDSQQFLLATTMEEVWCPPNMAAYVEGRSSVGRLGLQVQNASFIDSGFQGEITLELQNQTDVSMIIYPGMRICQIVYMMLTEESTSPYKGKYGGQSGATVSKFEGLE